MKIKWNWGTGIFLTLVTIIGFLAFMVNKTFDYTINKVTDDYYEEGLNHTQKMKRVKNGLPYQDDFLVIHTDVCTVKYPDFFKGKKMEGDVLFFRPSDYTKDLSFEIKMDTSAQQVLLLDNFLKGRYIVRASFSCEDTKYFLERDIIF